MTTSPEADVFRLLVTGSRDCTPQQKVFVGDVLDRTCAPFLAAGILVVVVEGRCPRGGVDLVAQHWAEQTPGAEDEGHPADWDIFGKAAGRRRNSVMVSRGAKLCVAFPVPTSRGTWDCVRKAADAGIPVRIYPLAMA